MSKKPTAEAQSPLGIEIDYTGMEGYAVLLLVMRDRADVPKIPVATCESELLTSPRVQQAFNTLAEMLARTAHERMFPELGPLTEFVHVHPDRKLN